MANTLNPSNIPRLPYRYPGVQPFTTAQSDVFFGRAEDVSELYNLVRHEGLVVLYGKSGLGKSSLLNAGIVPYCIQNSEYDPIIIKFGAWVEGKIDTPLELTKGYLKLGQDQAETLQKLLPSEDSLWRYAKNRQLNGNGRPMLIFDQFEELFSYPEIAIQAFKQELAELLHTDLPLRYRRHLDMDSGTGSILTEKEEEILETPLETRIIFAIRSDRMHLLHQLSTDLPNILRNLFELRPLNQLDARAAIVEPARKKGAFCTPPFQWSERALNSMLRYLQNPDDENRVEAILLQLLCQYFEEKLVEGRGLSLIELEELGDFENIIENYYHDKIEALPDPPAQYAARKLIEEGLILEGENIRLSLHEAQIVGQYLVNNDLLECLVNSRLLRSEPFLRGGYTYELAHDRLVAPVLRAKKERIADEDARSLELAKAQKEQELIEERGKRQRATMLAIIGLILTIIALSAAWWALRQNRIAKDALLKAEIATATARDSASVAIQQRELAKLEKRKADMSTSHALLKERQAQEAKKLANIALKSADQNAKIAAEILVNQAKKFIYILQYDKALLSAIGAMKLSQQKYQVRQVLQEIAFVYLESNNHFQESKDIINLISEFSKKPSISSALKDDIYLTREKIKQIDKENYDVLMRKYYPILLNVEGGSFMMGCDSTKGDKCDKDEQLHPVQVSTFALAQFETSYFQWAIYCISQNIELLKYNQDWGFEGDNPVGYLNWVEACQYTNWLSARFGLSSVYKIDSLSEETWDVSIIPNANGYRLPTEAEWEYAAKGGHQSKIYIYAGSNNIEEVALYEENNLINGVFRTMPVGSKKPNTLGFYDMSGNAWEWCWDWYDEKYYLNSPQKDPLGPLKNPNRRKVIRGGGLDGTKNNCRVANRASIRDQAYNLGTGVRVAK